MSKWNDFCAEVSKTTKVTAKKTKTIATVTSLRVKLNRLENSAADEYDVLGRLYYTQEVGKIDRSTALHDQIKVISDINKQINKVKAEIREIKKQEDEEKAARAAEKEAKKAAREADEPAIDE